MQYAARRSVIMRAFDADARCHACREMLPLPIDAALPPLAVIYADASAIIRYARYCR